jgi:hypothetical protein
MFLTLLVAVIIFILLWWLISLLPLPASMPSGVKNVLYIILISGAIYWLVTRSGLA